MGLVMTRGLSQKKRNSRSADRDSAKGPKRTADEVLRDCAEIARMRLEGLTQVQIVQEIGRLRDYSLSTHAKLFIYSFSC